MNFGIDIDDTITAEPEVFGAIMKALMSAGHGVHVITGLGDVEVRTAQLAFLGLQQGDAYTKIHIASADTADLIGQRKRDICAMYKIAMMFEDRFDFDVRVNEVSPCLLLMPRFRS